MPNLFDDFNRPNSTTGLGDPSDGLAPYEALAGIVGIYGGQAYGHTPGQDGYMLAGRNSGSADAEGGGIIVTGGEAGFAFRIQDAFNYLFVRSIGGSAALCKCQSGVISLLHYAGSAVPGDLLSYAPVSDQIKVKVNGVEVFTYTESFCQSAIKQGLWFQNTNMLDDFFVGGAGAAPLLVPTPSFVDATDVAAHLTSPQATGGVEPRSYQWQRATAADGTFSDVPGATGLLLEDSGISAGVDYWWRMKVTDAEETILYSWPVPGRLWPKPVVLGFLGDSITAPPSVAPQTCVNELASAARDRLFTLGPIRASGGEKSDDWLPTGTLLGPAKTAFAAAGVTHVHVMVGSNDSTNSGDPPVSPATYQANIQAIADDLVASGYVVILSSQLFYDKRPTPPGFTPDHIQAAHDYRASLDAIVNGTTILKGDRQAFFYFAGHLNELSDGLHPNVAGQVALGKLWAQGVREALG